MVMIDKASRNLLDKLISGTPDYARGVYSYDYICETFSIDEDEMFRIVNGLVALGLSRHAYWETDSDRQDFGILLTQRGITYREIKALEARERWKERIIGLIFGAMLAVIPQLIAFLVG